MKLNDVYVKYVKNSSREFISKISEISEERKTSLKKANEKFYQASNIKIQEEEVVLG